MSQLLHNVQDSSHNILTSSPFPGIHFLIVVTTICYRLCSVCGSCFFFPEHFLFFFNFFPQPISVMLNIWILQKYFLPVCHFQCYSLCGQFLMVHARTPSTIFKVRMCLGGVKAMSYRLFVASVLCLWSWCCFSSNQIHAIFDLFSYGKKGNSLYCVPSHSLIMPFVKKPFSHPLIHNYIRCLVHACNYTNVFSPLFSVIN